MKKKNRMKRHRFILMLLSRHSDKKSRGAGQSFIVNHWRVIYTPARVTGGKQFGQYFSKLC